MTIEDAYVLSPTQPNVVALKAAWNSQGERIPSRLLELSLRMRPDRITLGELQGKECTTIFEAINAGNGGSFTTIHADTMRKATHRLAIMVMSSRLSLGFEEGKVYWGVSGDLVVQLERRSGDKGDVGIFTPVISC